MQLNTSCTCFSRYTRTVMAAVLILLAHPAAGYQGSSIRQLHSVFSDAISVKDVIDYANGVDASVSQRRAFLELHDAYENSFRILQSIDMKQFERGPLRNAARYEGSQFEALQPLILAGRRIRKRIRQLDDQFFRDCEAICTDHQIRSLRKMARVRECERILANQTARSISPYPLIDLVTMVPEFLLESETPGIDELVRQYGIRSVSSLRSVEKALEEDLLKRSRALDAAGLFRDVMSGSDVPREVFQRAGQIGRANSGKSNKAVIRHLELNSQFLRSPLWLPRQGSWRAMRNTYFSRIYRGLNESIEHVRTIDSWLEVIETEPEGNLETTEEAHELLTSHLGQCDRLLMSTEQKIIDHMRKTPSDASIALRRIAAGDDIDDCNEQIQSLRKQAEEYLQASMPHVLELARARKPDSGGLGADSGQGQAANVPPSQSGDSDVLPAPFIHLPPIDRREFERYITMLGILPEMETFYEVSHKDYLIDVDTMHAAVRDLAREETPDVSVMPVGVWIAAHDTYTQMLAKRDNRLIEELATLSEDRGDQLSRVKLVRAITRNNPPYPRGRTAAESKINLLELLLNEARESDIPNTALATVFEGPAGKLIVLFETRSRILSEFGNVLAQIGIETEEIGMGQLMQDIERLNNEKDSINREIIELHHSILRQVGQSMGGSGIIDAIRFNVYMEAYREYLQPIERLTTMFAQLLKGDLLGTEARARVVECRGDFRETLKAMVDELAVAMRRWEGMSLSSDERSPPDMGEYEHWLNARTRIDAIEQLCQRTLVDVIEIFDGDDITMFPSLHAAKQLLFDES